MFVFLGSFLGAPLERIEFKKRKVFVVCLAVALDLHWLQIIEYLLLLLVLSVLLTVVVVVVFMVVLSVNVAPLRPLIVLGDVRLACQLVVLMEQKSLHVLSPPARLVFSANC